jgi:DNA-directed RNA polymerase specialized sigma24 family protein
VRRLYGQCEDDLAVAKAVSRAKSGDWDAVRLLYGHYRESVEGYVISMIRDKREAEHVTQHVFLKLATVIQTYDPHRVPFPSWLFRVTRTVALDHLRQERSPGAEEQPNVVMLGHVGGVGHHELVDDAPAAARAAAS